MFQIEIYENAKSKIQRAFAPFYALTPLWLLNTIEIVQNSLFGEEEIPGQKSLNREAKSEKSCNFSLRTHLVEKERKKKFYSTEQNPTEK